MFQQIKIRNESELKEVSWNELKENRDYIIQVAYSSEFYIASVFQIETRSFKNDEDCDEVWFAIKNDISLNPLYLLFVKMLINNSSKYSLVDIEKIYEYE